MNTNLIFGLIFADTPSGFECFNHDYNFDAALKYVGIEPIKDNIDNFIFKKGSTKNYHTRMRRMIKNGLIIRFHKVKAHSGDRWNNVADALAKQSCNLD